MPNKKINQLDTRTGAALTDLILIGDPTSGTSFKLTATDFKTLLNNVPYTGATTNVNLGAFNLTAASIIRTGGTSSQFLKADGSVDSSTYTPTSRTLTINGVTQDLSADRTFTIAAGITGSGTSGQVAYWNGTSSQTGSNNLFWNNANSRLGIATNSPSYRLEIAAEASGNTGIKIAGLNTNAAVVDLFSSTTHVGAFFGTGSSLSFGTYQSSQVSLESYSTGGVSLRTNNGANAHIRFYAGNASASQSPEIARFYSTTGNLVLQNGGTFTDGGQRLQVQGDAFIKGSGATFGTVALQIQNSSSTNLFRVYNNGYARLGNTNSTTLFGPQQTGAIGIDPNGTNFGFYSYTSTQVASEGRYYFGGEQMIQTSGANYNIFSIANFFPTSGTATFANTIISSQINQTGGANGITRGLYVNPTLTAAADWRSIEWSNNSGWGLYGAGTANNYLGGSLGIGTTSPANILEIVRNQNASTTLIISNSTNDTLADTRLRFKPNAGSFEMGKNSIATTAYKIFLGSDSFFYNGYNGDISILNDHSTGKIKFAAGASSTAQMTLTAAGRLLLGTTTESTFLLDVNGTARVSGAMTLSSATPSITLGGDLTISNTPYPSRSISIDILNSNINLLAGGFGEGMFIGGRLTSSRTATNYVQPDGLYGTGSGKISPYDSAGNVIVQAANNGNRSICLRPLQSVLIGDITTGNGTVYNAILRCDSTDKGFMPPRMTTTQKNAIASPTAGLMVFDTTLAKLCVYSGTAWETITSI
jgi:hypothetical protein